MNGMTGAVTPNAKIHKPTIKHPKSQKFLVLEQEGFDEMFHNLQDHPLEKLGAIPEELGSHVKSISHEVVKAEWLVVDIRHGPSKYDCLTHFSERMLKHNSRTLKSAVMGPLQSETIFVIYVVNEQTFFESPAFAVGI